jgi:hypothetical protein
MRILAFIGVAVALSAATANAQNWASIQADVIGQAVGNAVAGQGPVVDLCMSGQVTHQMQRSLHVRDRAQAAMLGYVSATRASDHADVSRYFARSGGRWTQAEASGELTAINDPLARRLGNAELPLPTEFVESGDSRSAIAQWVLRDPSNTHQVAGAYRGTFTIDHGRWVLSALEVFDSAEALGALRPYCHEAGDVDAYLAAAEAKDKTDEAAPEAAPAAAP